MKRKRVEALRLTTGQGASINLTDMGLSYDQSGRIMKVEAFNADGLKGFGGNSRNRVAVMETAKPAEVEMTEIYKEMKIQVRDYKMRKNQEVDRVGTTTSSARQSIVGSSVDEG